MDYDITIAVTQQASGIGHLDTCEHELAVGNKAMDIGADPCSVFIFALEIHSVPFVVGRSVETILTA